VPQVRRGVLRVVEVNDRFGVAALDREPEPRRALVRVDALGVQVRAPACRSRPATSLIVAGSASGSGCSYTCDRSENPMPNALNTAAVRGMSTSRTPAFLAAPHTVIGPAPPNAATTVSWSTAVLASSALAISAVWASSIRRSASSRVIPSGPAILLSIALALRSGCRSMVPPR